MGLNIGKKAQRFERLTKPGQGTRRLSLGSTYTSDYKDDPRTMKRAIGGAVLFHLILLLVTFPEMRAKPRHIQSGQKAYVVQQVRFKPPPPNPARKLPNPETKKIPIPDPTPDDPEPIRIDSKLADLDVPDVGEFLDFPGPASAGPPGPLHVTGNVKPPVKIFAPQPRYTEEARKARIQGVVILQAIIDALGNVTNVRILKGLPEGLADSAVDTVRQWKFKPATVEGEPVPVYFNLTVSFSLQ